MEVAKKSLGGCAQTCNSSKKKMLIWKGESIYSPKSPSVSIYANLVNKKKKEKTSFQKKPIVLSLYLMLY